MIVMLQNAARAEYYQNKSMAMAWGSPVIVSLLRNVSSFHNFNILLIISSHSLKSSFFFFFFLAPTFGSVNLDSCINPSNEKVCRIESNGASQDPESE